MSQEKPLEGVRVADFSWIGAGPHSTKLLGAFGADVVRIESHNRPDLLRLQATYDMGNPMENLNLSAFFGEFNQGKRSIKLDLSSEEGRGIARDLVEEADVLAEAFSPGFMDRIGLDYESVREFNPDIVYLSMPGWANTGPAKGYRSYGLNLQSMAGLDYISGFPDDPPTSSGQSWPDSVSGVIGAIGMMYGITRRERTGEGTYIEVPQFENTITFLHKPMMEWFMHERLPERVGNRDEDGRYVQGIYECAGEDRWAAVAVGNDEQWETFCEVIGHPEYATDERFDSQYRRLVNHDEVDAIIEAWTSRRAPEEVRYRLQDHDVPAGTVANERDLMEYDEQARVRDYFAVHDHPEVGEQTWGGIPFNMSDTNAEYESAFPLLGAHTTEVLQEWLGMSDKEIEDYLKEEVLV